ncbi:rac guanyl-nucleotide exchange factor [Schistosoma japonicum]|nr:rac guanyl-nucleotide exchange factor [Schistosoma japonicum]
MAADGVAWLPSSNTNNSAISIATTTEKTKFHQPMLQKTDQLRWYSEEIEEEKVNNNSLVKSNSILESHHSSKCDPSSIHNEAILDNSLTKTLSEPAHSSNLPCPSSSLSSTQKLIKSPNSNFGNSQNSASESSFKQVELEAKLEEAMTIRKQQDDYIKQLQMYYDNLLTKHALAEVTIDQLRMGMRVGFGVSSGDTLSHSQANKPRSHSMQTLHYNINNRLVSVENCSQAIGYHQTGYNDSRDNNNVHYSSTPLLEQQKHQLKRNSSTHDEKVISTTSDSWETGLGCLINSGQIIHRNDTSNINLISNQSDDKRSACYKQDLITQHVQNHSHFRKTSEPLSSPSSDFHSELVNDPINISINQRRNTMINSCRIPQQQQTQLNVPPSPNRNPKSTVTESGIECNRNELIIDKEDFNNTPTLVNDDNNKLQNCSKDLTNGTQHSEKLITPSTPTVNVNTNLNDILCGPEAVQMELLLRVADLQTRLSTMELCATQHRFISEADLVTMQLDYGTLKNYYNLAKIRWSKDPQFDANNVLMGELNLMGSQLSKLGSYALSGVEAVSSPSSNLSSPEPLPTPQPTSISISDLPVNWKDLNLFKLSGQTSSGEHKPVKNTTDSGVLSSPSSLPSRSDHGRLSSVSPLHSPIVEDSLSELESVYFELMQHYNKIKQLPMTTSRTEQLYNLMKRLYDLALTAENRSSIIASPDELERIFQLDGDTRKLSENLERAIALQKQLSNYQNSHSSESNSSSHNGAVPQTGETVDGKLNLLKENSAIKMSSTASLSSYSRCDMQNNKMNSTHSDAFASQDSSSNQDSGLSTPPESSDGMKHDDPDDLHHNSSKPLQQHCQSYYTFRQKRISNNSSSQTDNSSNTQKQSRSDSGFTTQPKTVRSSKQSVYGEQGKSLIRKSPVISNCPVYDNDGQDKTVMVMKKSSAACSPTLSSSPTTKQRIDDLEKGIRLLKENLENLCLKADNCTPNDHAGNVKSSFYRKPCENAPPISSQHNNLPMSSVNNSNIFCFPHTGSSHFLKNNNKNTELHSSSGYPNILFSDPRSNVSNNLLLSETQAVDESHCNLYSYPNVNEENFIENPNCKQLLFPPGRTYRRTLDRRLVACNQENDYCYLPPSVNKPSINNKVYAVSKSNRPTSRTLSNNSRKMSRNFGNSRDLSCSRIITYSQSNNNSTQQYSSCGLSRLVKCHSTYELNQPPGLNSISSSHSSTSSVSSDYSTVDSPTIGSHDSSTVSSSSDDDSKLHRSPKYKPNRRLSAHDSSRQRNPLSTPVPKSIMRSDQSKSPHKSHRSTSLCKPNLYHTPLRSLTNIQGDYGSLNHLNCTPFNKYVTNSNANPKFGHNLINTYGGSVPVVGNLDTLREPVYPQHSVNQQSSRVYTAFDSIQRKPQIPFQPSLYFYPSTERILYSHPVQMQSVNYLDNRLENTSFSPFTPCDASTSCMRTMTCSACGGSGQVLDNCNSDRLVEPPLIRPIIGLSPLYRKTSSSASLFENENSRRNVVFNSPYHHENLRRIDQSTRLGSLSEANKHSHSKHKILSNHGHVSSCRPKYSHHPNRNGDNNNDNHNNSKNIGMMYSTEDNNSNTTSIDKHSDLKKTFRRNTQDSTDKCFHPSQQSSSSSSTLLPTSLALQEILKAASSTGLLAQKLRCSLEDLCKTELK